MAMAVCRSLACAAAVACMHRAKLTQLCRCRFQYLHRHGHAFRQNSKQWRALKLRTQELSTSSYDFRPGDLSFSLLLLALQLCGG